MLIEVIAFQLPEEMTGEKLMNNYEVTLEKLRNTG